MRAAIAHFSAAKCEACQFGRREKVRLLASLGNELGYRMIRRCLRTTSKWGIRAQVGSRDRDRIKLDGITNGLITSALLRTSNVIPSAGAASTAGTPRRPDAPACFQPNDRKRAG